MGSWGSNMSSRLDNRIALVTSAARGIGAAIAELFHAEGAQLLVTDIDDAAGESLAARLGDRCRYAHLDRDSENKSF